MRIIAITAFTEIILAIVGRVGRRKAFGCLLHRWRM